MSMKDTGCPISKEIYLKEFFDDFKQENVQECSYSSINTNDVGSDVNLLAKTELINHQIIENCSINNLSCETDKCLWDEIKIVAPRTKSHLGQFKTFEYFQKGLNEHNNISEFMNETNRSFKISKDLSYKNARDMPLDNVNVSDSISLILDELLITVIIFKPLKNSDCDFKSANLIKYLKPELRIDLLGSQTLKDLLKVISCKNSDSLMGDFSEIMNDWNNYKVNAKDIYKGGFFLIENTFYDIEEEEDLSTPIINWVSKSVDRIKQFGILEKKSMQDVRLIDLHICIGKPYLFQHLADCEHFLVFADVRLINKNDCQNRSNYPIITGKSCYKPIKCLFCETTNTEWLVTNCKITPSELTPMCDYCHRMILYDENFKKIDNAGDFKVFRFPSFL